MITLPVQANNLTVKPVKMQGHTTYIIEGDQSGGFKSELEFPLNITALNLDYSLDIKNKYIKRYKIALQHSLNDYAGKFHDSDWLYDYQDDKAIYSESDAYLDTYTIINQIDFKELKFLSTDKLHSNLLLGYRYQYFDYDIHNLVQHNYLSGNTSKIKGKVLTYEVDYSYFYTGLNLNNKNKDRNFNWQLRMLYSPFVKANDNDIHLLRDKVSEINAEGYSYSFDGSIKYDFTDSIYINFLAQYLNMHAKGKQIQKNYKNEILFKDIDAEIYSVQKSFSLGLGYSF